jgi:hypothetical protein
MMMMMMMTMMMATMMMKKRVGRPRHAAAAHPLRLLLLLQVQGLAARPAAMTVLQAALLSRRQSQAAMQRLRLVLLQGSCQQVVAVFVLMRWAQQGARW